MYQQDDRDIRAERAEQKLERATRCCFAVVCRVG